MHSISFSVKSLPFIIAIPSDGVSIFKSISGLRIHLVALSLEFFCGTDGNVSSLLQMIFHADVIETIVCLVNFAKLCEGCKSSSNSMLSSSKSRFNKKQDDDERNKGTTISKNSICLCSNWGFGGGGGPKHGGCVYANPTLLHIFPSLVCHFDSKQTAPHQNDKQQSLGNAVAVTSTTSLNFYK